jgi:hypothetical protein
MTTLAPADIGDVGVTARYEFPASCGEIGPTGGLHDMEGMALFRALGRKLAPPYSEYRLGVWFEPEAGDGPVRNSNQFGVCGAPPCRMGTFAGCPDLCDFTRHTHCLSLPNTPRRCRFSSQSGI